MDIDGCIDGYIEFMALLKPLFRFNRGGDNDDKCM